MARHTRVLSLPAQIQLLKYNDEEYEHLINPDSKDWSRHETDYLMDLCERFDLRFIVIHDRYDVRAQPHRGPQGHRVRLPRRGHGKQSSLSSWWCASWRCAQYVPPQGATAPTRSLDDLKERYYSIARRLLIAREGGESQVRATGPTQPQGARCQLLKACNAGAASTRLLTCARPPPPPRHPPSLPLSLWQVANHPLVRHPFNKALEAERKKAVEALLLRTPQQAAEENAVSGARAFGPMDTLRKSCRPEGGGKQRDAGPERCSTGDGAPRGAGAAHSAEASG